MPTPDRRRPELTANLRTLRANLEQLRTFHLRRLAERPVTGRSSSARRLTISSPRRPDAPSATSRSP